MFVLTPDEAAQAAASPPTRRVVAAPSRVAIDWNEEDQEEIGTSEAEAIPRADFPRRPPSVPAPAPAFLAATTEPQGAKLVFEAQAEPKAFVGDAIRVTVRLRNEGSVPIVLPTFREAQDSVTFVITLDGGRPSLFQRTYPRLASKTGGDALSKTESLFPGQIWELFVELPAIVAGAFVIEPKLLAADDEQLCADPLRVEVVPSGGFTEAGVQLHTSLGPIEIRLFSREALATSLHVARLVREGYYNDLIFHRVVHDFVIQAGCPQGNGLGGAGYTIPFEVPSGTLPEHMKNVIGSVAIARSQKKGSGSGQFYVNLVDSKQLDGEYAVFGQVEYGMDTVERIGRVEVDYRGRPNDPVSIHWAGLRLR